MNRAPRVVSALLGIAALFFGASASAATLAAGDLRLEIDPAGRVTAMAVGSKPLEVAPAPLVEVCPAETGRWIAPAVWSGGPASGWHMDFGDAQLAADATAKPRGDMLQFTCRVHSATGQARGLLVRFAFPLSAADWQWHRDIQRAETIEAEKTYEDLVPLRAWADLPEWKDQPELRMGYSSRNFTAAVTGPVGLALAVPLDWPCIFRTAYRGPAKRLEIVYDFALAPQTRTPNEAEFSFFLYSFDPRLGLRGALERFYRAFPEMFVRLVNQPGQWMPFARLSEIDNADEFGFGLQEGAPEPEYDDRLGVLSTTYFTHAGMGANIPNFDPEKDPLPPYDVQVQAMEAAFRQRTGMDGVYAQVGLWNAQGRLDVRPWVAYAHLIAQFNLDPELPYGRWTLDRALAMLDDIRARRGGELDGFYYDGLSTGVNYRPDHFGTADALCLWDPVAKKPLLNNFFSSCEFARAAAELLRPRGKITMMNGALGASFYVAPWLDVLGSETGLSLPRDQLNYIRSVTYHKPFLTLLKGNYEQRLLRPQIEEYMKRCMPYGVLPGFFDWPTSGLGPGGSYWEHPAYYERDRDLHRKYQPLCRALSAAGWEPVTHARSSAPSVMVERFGPAPDGPMWLTLANDGKEAVKTTLSIEAKALGLDAAAIGAEDCFAGRGIALAAQGDEAAAEIEVPAGDVLVLAVGTPATLRAWHLAQAIDTLDRGVRMRAIDKDKPPLPTHWRPRGRTCSRDASTGAPRLVLSGDGQSAGVSQWAMPFQEKPDAVVLRVRAAGDKLAGPKGTVGVECRLAWVTPTFAHYETRFFELPGGAYEEKDFEFPIQCAEALRAIQVTPTLRSGATGSLRLAKVSLSDAAGNEYAVDPEFRQWYEPVPQALRGPIEEQIKELRGRLETLGAAASRGESERKEATAAIDRQIEALRQLIAQHKAESGCRRVLRDLETIASHVEAVQE